MAATAVPVHLGFVCVEFGLSIAMIFLTLSVVFLSTVD
jgi:hypothetical protein